MSSLREVKYTSRSITPPPKRRSRSRSVSPPRSSRARSRSRSRDSVDVDNPGNNLYITGLSTRVTSSDLEKYFSKEGKVLECQVVTDPRTRESRGFAFVTMEAVKDAERCIKYLNRSVLEGRLITVEKLFSSLEGLHGNFWHQVRVRVAASICVSPSISQSILLTAKRSRGRTPTPGTYRGPREKRDGGRKRSRSRSPYRSRQRDRSRSRSRRERSRSPYARDSRRRRRERSVSGGSDGHR